MRRAVVLVKKYFLLCFTFLCSDICYFSFWCPGYVCEFILLHMIRYVLGDIYLFVSCFSGFCLHTYHRSAVGGISLDIFCL